MRLQHSAVGVVRYAGIEQSKLRVGRIHSELRMQQRPLHQDGCLETQQPQPLGLTPQLEVQRLGVEQNAAVAADEYRLAIDE